MRNKRKPVLMMSIILCVAFSLFISLQVSAGAVSLSESDSYWFEEPGDYLTETEIVKDYRDMQVNGEEVEQGRKTKIADDEASKLEDPLTSRISSSESIPITDTPDVSEYILTYHDGGLPYTYSFQAPNVYQEGDILRFYVSEQEEEPSAVVYDTAKHGTNARMRTTFVGKDIFNETAYVSLQKANEEESVRVPLAVYGLPEVTDIGLLEQYFTITVDQEWEMTIRSKDGIVLPKGVLIRFYDDNQNPLPVVRNAQGVESYYAVLAANGEYGEGKNRVRSTTNISKSKFFANVDKTLYLSITEVGKKESKELKRLDLPELSPYSFTHFDGNRYVFSAKNSFNAGDIIRVYQSEQAEVPFHENTIPARYSDRNIITNTIISPEPLSGIAYVSVQKVGASEGARRKVEFTENSVVDQYSDIALVDQYFTFTISETSDNRLHISVQSTEAIRNTQGILLRFYDGEGNPLPPVKIEGKEYFYPAPQSVNGSSFRNSMNITGSSFYKDIRDVLKVSITEIGKKESQELFAIPLPEVTSVTLSRFAGGLDHTHAVVIRNSNNVTYDAGDMLRIYPNQEATEAAYTHEFQKSLQGQEQARRTFVTDQIIMETAYALLEKQSGEIVPVSLQIWGDIIDGGETNGALLDEYFDITVTDEDGIRRLEINSKASSGEFEIKNDLLIRFYDANGDVLSPLNERYHAFYVQAGMYGESRRTYRSSVTIDYNAFFQVDGVVPENLQLSITELGKQESSARKTISLVPTIEPVQGTWAVGEAVSANLQWASPLTVSSVVYSVHGASERDVPLEEQYYQLHTDKTFELSQEFIDSIAQGIDVDSNPNGLVVVKIIFQRQADFDPYLVEFNIVKR